MTVIKKLSDEMMEELCSAKEYAEMYLEQKAMDDSSWANRFKEMATLELNHAGYLHDFAIKKIEQLSRVYEPPIEMQEKWDHAHEKFVEKAAWIRQMLAM